MSDVQQQWDHLFKNEQRNTQILSTKKGVVDVTKGTTFINLWVFTYGLVFLTRFDT